MCTVHRAGALFSQHTACPDTPFGTTARDCETHHSAVVTVFIHKQKIPTNQNVFHYLFFGDILSAFSVSLVIPPKFEPAIILRIFHCNGVMTVYLLNGNGKLRCF